ncbi:short-chain dehydrogenase [Fulvitalea axinellae]|uniref:Short-chain dehydrogenase n=1 Tax=Fulvitalea axinellae TaxID=1182444 RepID=A0AAU9D9X5_9BACT|nr:short-chain dehydrogenase [Fulvitalea axinellae]
MEQIFNVKGKSGFITGAGGGIGSFLAKELAKAGVNLALVDLDTQKVGPMAEELSGEFGVVTKAYACDVTDPESVKRMTERYSEDFPALDFAINNAGIANIEKAMDISYEDFKKVVDVNLNGVFLCAQAAARLMKGRGGSIVNMASMSAHIVNVPQTIANYCASKGGVKTLTKALAVEWAQENIRVNSVSPGYIATELVAGMKDYHPGWISRIPMGRLGKPEDLIGLFVYLLSDASAYMTGSDLIIDGGYTSL